MDVTEMVKKSLDRIANEQEKIAKDRALKPIFCRDIGATVDVYNFCSKCSFWNKDSCAFDIDD